MEIKPRTLKVFCAVVDTGSLALAGGQVALSASAVSRIISQLEAYLGVPLFDRTQRRLVPTAAGREFHRRAREALPLFDELASFGRRTAVADRPPLRVAALSRHAESVTAPALAGLLTTEPGFGPVQLDVHAQRDFGFSRLARPFDIGFGNLAGSHPDLVTETLAMAPIVVAMPQGHPLAALDRVPVAALRSHPLIQLTRDTVIGTIVEEALDAASLAATAKAKVSHTNVALEMVRADAGLHVTDAMAVLAAQGRGVVVRPLETRQAVPILAFWPVRSEALTSHAQSLKQAVHAMLGGFEVSVDGSDTGQAGYARASALRLPQSDGRLASGRNSSTRSSSSAMPAGGLAARSQRHSRGRSPKR